VIRYSLKGEDFPRVGQGHSVIRDGGRDGTVGGGSWCCFFRCH